MRLFPNLFARKTMSRSERKQFTGNCLVRQHTGDGVYVGRCYYSTYNNVCHLHGDVSEWLELDDDIAGGVSIENYRAWPNDYDLPRFSQNGI